MTSISQCGFGVAIPLITAAVIVASNGSVSEASDTPDELLAACQKIVRAHPEALDSYQCFRGFAYQRGQFDLAARALERLLNKDPNNHRARLILAALAADQGSDRSELLFKSAIESLSRDDDPAEEATGRLMWGTFLMRRGRVDEATSEFAVADRLLSGSTDGVLRARLQLAKGWLAYRRNDYGSAWSLLQELQSDLPPSSPVDLRSSLLSALGAVSWTTGRLEAAVGHYLQQAALQHEAGNLYDEASARINLTLLAPTHGRPRAVLAREALAVAEAGGNRAVQSQAHVYLSEAAVGPDRMFHARRALELSREVRDAGAIQMALRAVANVSLDVDSRAAFQAIEEAIHLASARGDLAEVARNSLIRSRMRWQSGTRDRAIADSLAALDAIEAERRRQPDYFDRARRVDMWQTAYNELVARVLSTREGTGRGDDHSSQDVELAFMMMERGRARSLLEYLSRQSHPLTLDAEARRLEQERHEVWTGLVRRQQELSNPQLDATVKQRALVDLDRLERRDVALRREMAAANAALASSGSATLATLAEIRRALSPDEMLLQPQITFPAGLPEAVTASWVLVSTRAETRAFPLPRVDKIDDIAPLFAGLIARRDGSERSAARELFKRLFGGVLADLPKTITRLILVPDTALHDLPFDLLRTDSGEPLAARYDVSIVPSATTWLHWRTRAAGTSVRGALAFVDPAGWGRGSRPAGERIWTLPTGSVLGPLPYARREGEALVRHTIGERRVLAGVEATEARLKGADLNTFGLLHFAAHAVVDDDHAERSAILLAPGSDEEDGWLQPREIERLELDGKVVVLSACRSANGALIRGEGLVGLTDAFFRAGAHAVVASLWPLGDEDAARLFEGFYRHLGSGATVAAALAAARRDRAASGAPAAAWAGVVLLGDGGIALAGDPANASPMLPSVVIGATLGIGLALGLVLARRVSRRRG